MRPVALVALAAMIVPVSAPVGATSEEAIVALVHAFSDARARFDAKTLDTLLTPDYVEVSPRGEIDRRPAVLAFYAPDRATPVPPMSLSMQEVRRFGDTAIVVGSVEYEVPGPGGATVKRTVRVTYVERRVGNRWLMAATQYTGVQPPQPLPR